MTNQDSNSIETTPADRAEMTGRAKPARPDGRRRTLVVGAVAASLAVCAVGLSVAQPGRAEAPAAIEPVAVSALRPSGAIAAKGEVAEIFGNKFVVQDPSGRALVETGRAGESGNVVSQGETVTVQGRFEHGFLHAMLITRADGTKIVVAPAAGPGPGPIGWVKDKMGLGPKLDVPTMTAGVERAGYHDVRIVSRGPRHLELAAKAQDGSEHALHVDADGRIREKPSL